MRIQTGSLTPVQIRDKTIRDLKTKNENDKIKAGIRESELQEEIDALKRARSGDGGTIAMLQREIASLTAENDALRSEIGALNQKLAASGQTIQKLMLILGKDSSNSSKPPSTNGYRKIPNSRDKSLRPIGAPKGHPGHRLKLPENLDELVENGFAEKRIVDHTGGSEEYVSRWTLDVEVKTIVTEHRFAKDAALPKGMENEVTYGDGIKALTVLLSNEGIIAEDRLAGFFEEMTHGAISLSDATIENFSRQFANRLPDELKAIENDLLSHNVMHVDDTPLDCTQKMQYGKPGEDPVLITAENTTFTVYLRNYSNEQSTLYTVNPQKDQEGIERDGILPRYMHTLSHDHEAKFYNFGSAHATCCGHLTRDLRGLHELENCPWAKDMRAFMLEMNAHKNADLKNNISSCDKEQLHKYEEQYDALLSEGRAAHSLLVKGELGENSLKNMIARLTDYKDEYLLFMRDYEMPFTNNLSERDLRASKTRLKVSGCFRSWEGVNANAKITGFVSTAKKRKRNILDSIISIFKGIPVFAGSAVKTEMPAPAGKADYQQPA